MAYYIITYRVVISDKTYNGKVGRATNKPDKLVNETKIAIKDGYANKFSAAVFKY